MIVRAKIDGPRVKILVIDSNQALCTEIQTFLSQDGYLLDVATNSQTALKLLGDNLYNLVIAEAEMPRISGLQLLHEAKKKSRDTIVILTAASNSVESAVQCMKQGAYDYVTKPLDLPKLRQLVASALEFQFLVADNKELRLRRRNAAEPSLLLGNSTVVRNVVSLAEEVARSEVTVLIEGESGTGKEIVARTIHARSMRRDKPFITVNCAALAEQLLEAELFGHVKGAFTGAVTDKLGRFQLADEGTLFLDEIGDLSPKGQGDLLRVLDDGTFRMVGGTKLIRVNVRVLAATNKNLQESVSKGQFREDLFYRLQIVPISLPPLRERAEDIPLLIDSFLEHFTAKHKRRRKTFDKEAIQLCQRFPWPGNVRQLRNVVERLVITCKNSTIQVSDLPDFIRAHDRSAAEQKIRPGMSLAEVEKLLIRLTLTHSTDNREEAAKILGISRRTLQYKLKEYGLLKDANPKSTVHK